MKVKLVSNVITPYGSLDKGMELSSDKYPESFLRHLVNDCNAATIISNNEKMVKQVIENKIEPTLQENKSNKKKNTAKKKRS